MQVMSKSVQLLQETRAETNIVAASNCENGGNGIALGQLVNRCVEPVTVETVSQVVRR